MSDKLPCDLALVKCNSLTKSWIQKWLCYCPRVWTCIETEKTRTKLTLCDWNSFSLLSSVNISQLPERQDWCWLSEEFLADPVTHKHTDMTDYNTLRCSLARSVIKPKQTPVKHCAKIVKNCFLPLSSNIPGKQTVCVLKHPLENCHKDIYTLYTLKVESRQQGPLILSGDFCFRFRPKMNVYFRFCFGFGHKYNFIFVGIFVYGRKWKCIFGRPLMYITKGFGLGLEMQSLGLVIEH